MTVNRDGRSYEVHVFRRALFPLTPGRYAIASARLAYTLAAGAELLQPRGVVLPALRGRSRSSRSSRRPPGARRTGRAPWACGGRARERTRPADAPGIRFVLTLRLEGTGNVTLLPRPRLHIPWADVVAAERAREGRLHARRRCAGARSSTGSSRRARAARSACPRCGTPISIRSRGGTRWRDSPTVHRAGRARGGRRRADSARRACSAGAAASRCAPRWATRRRRRSATSPPCAGCCSSRRCPRSSPGS